MIILSGRRLTKAQKILDEYSEDISVQDVIDHIETVLGYNYSKSDFWQGEKRKGLKTTREAPANPKSLVVELKKAQKAIDYLLTTIWQIPGKWAIGLDELHGEIDSEIAKLEKLPSKSHRPKDYWIGRRNMTKEVLEKCLTHFGISKRYQSTYHKVRKSDKTCIVDICMKAYDERYPQKEKEAIKRAFDRLERECNDD